MRLAGVIETGEKADDEASVALLFYGVYQDC